MSFHENRIQSGRGLAPQNDRGRVLAHLDDGRKDTVAGMATALRVDRRALAELVRAMTAAGDLQRVPGLSGAPSYRIPQ